MQLDNFFSNCGPHIPVFDYRKYTGEYSTASAVAAVLASSFIDRGRMPAALGFNDVKFKDKGILMLGLGRHITAIEILL